MSYKLSRLFAVVQERSLPVNSSLTLRGSVEVIKTLGFRLGKASRILIKSQSVSCSSIGKHKSE